MQDAAFIFCACHGLLVDLTGSGCHARIQLDLAKRAFVAIHILLQDGHQRLGLLRAQINALEVLYFDLGLALLLQRAEDQKKVPHTYPHLHAIGVVLAVTFGFDQFDIGLIWIRHGVFSVAATEGEGKCVGVFWTAFQIVHSKITMAITDNCR